jgi:uncharacterized protein (DUF1499 family)
MSSLMSIVKWLAIALVLFAMSVVGAGQMGLLRGPVPADLGVRDGKLKAPSATANSVSSQAALHSDHPQRNSAAIAPLPSGSDGRATLARIAAIVEAMQGGRVVKSEPDYLYAEFTTRLMGFVDDVEFWFDPVAQVIQVRSASRIGRSDFGANRRRIEEVRAALAAKG